MKDVLFFLIAIPVSMFIVLGLFGAFDTDDQNPWKTNKN